MRMKMVPIIVENNNNAVAGLYILLLVICFIILCLLLYVRRQRTIKIYKAKHLIEAGYEKKRNYEEWKND